MVPATISNNKTQSSDDNTVEVTTATHSVHDATCLITAVRATRASTEQLINMKLSSESAHPAMARRNH